MTKFVDAAGREWPMPAKLTTRLFTTLRDEFGLDLRLMLKDDSTALARALMDDEVIGNALWLLCKSHCEPAGVTKEDFTDFDSDAVIRAREALQELFLTFTQGPAIAPKSMARARAAREKAMERLTSSNGALNSAVLSE